MKEIAREGGRVDITYRGEPQVTLLRVADAKGHGSRQTPGVPGALRIELACPEDDLVGEIRKLRQGQGHPRTFWLPDGGQNRPSPARKRAVGTQRPKRAGERRAKGK